MNESMTAAERRELAGELADDLVGRGLTLADVEKLAPLLVDRVRLTVRAARDTEGLGLCE